MIRLVFTLAMLAMPALAEACASCIGSPFGDRTYNWPYLVLILVPFAVGTAIAATMMRVTGTTFADLRTWLAQVFHSDAGQEETT